MNDLASPLNMEVVHLDLNHIIKIDELIWLDLEVFSGLVISTILESETQEDSLGVGNLEVIIGIVDVQIQVDEVSIWYL